MVPCPRRLTRVGPVTHTLGVRVPSSPCGHPAVPVASSWRHLSPLWSRHAVLACQHVAGCEGRATRWTSPVLSLQASRDARGDARMGGPPATPVDCLAIVGAAVRRACRTLLRGGCDRRLSRGPPPT